MKGVWRSALMLGLIVCGLTRFGIASAQAECANPDALGTSRTLVVDPTEHQLLGTMQYRETLPLQPGEVVLTFDDGPLPPYTTRVLEALAHECAKATFFLVGRMSRAYPDSVRAIAQAGHTIATHSMNHPLTFHRMSVEKAQAEINGGIEAAQAALGDSAKVAPFFRIPGLLRQDQVETYLHAQNLMTWSADFPADDWRKISAARVKQLALQRLEAKGKGILLLHDIQPATVLMLPELLRELITRGFRLVHVVPATASLRKTETTPDQWRLYPPQPEIASIWPKPPETFTLSAAQLPILDLPVSGALTGDGSLAEAVYEPGPDLFREIRIPVRARKGKRKDNAKADAHAQAGAPARAQQFRIVKRFAWPRVQLAALARPSATQFAAPGEDLFRLPVPAALLNGATERHAGQSTSLRPSLPFGLRDTLHAAPVTTAMSKPDMPESDAPRPGSWPRTVAQ